MRDDLRQWRTAAESGTPLPPLVVEVYLDVSELKPKQSLVFTDAQGKTWPGERKEIVLERWIVEFRPDQKGQPEDLPVVYKRCIVAMRALYTLSRLLPTWSLYQRLTRQKLAASPLRIGCRALDGSRPISSRGRVGLSEKIGASPSSTPPSSALSVSPDATSHLASYAFSPITTPAGTLNLTISYRTEVNFGIDDADVVFAQQFLELDRPTELSTPRSRSRPIVSFTQPFRTPEPAAMNTNRARTPSNGSVARANSTGPNASGVVGSSPVPVPKAGASGTAAGSFNSSTSSSMHRFLSSFASRQSAMGRPGSLESRHSVDYRSNPVSTASTPSSLEPGSGIYVPNSGVGDFMRFVNDTQKRASGFKGHTSTSLDNSLSKYQNMRQSYMQLTESLMLSSQRIESPVEPGPVSPVRPSGFVGSPSSARSLSPSRPIPLIESLSPTNPGNAFPHASSAPAAVAPVEVLNPVAGSISQGKLSGGAASALARYAHPPIVPSRLSEQYSGRSPSVNDPPRSRRPSSTSVTSTSRTSAAQQRARNRLSYYIDSDTAGPGDEDDDVKDGSDDELLFAMSDMNCI